jgi:hypothetical protein
MSSLRAVILAAAASVALVGCSPREAELTLTTSSDFRFRAEIAHETVLSDAAGNVLVTSDAFDTPTTSALAPGIYWIVTTVSTSGVRVTRPQPGEFRPGGMSQTGSEAGPPQRVGACQRHVVLTRPIQITVDVTARGCTIAEG